jgi:DMSO reductase anchor subunit
MPDRSLPPDAQGPMTKLNWAWFSFLLGGSAMLLTVLLAVDGGALRGGWLFAIALLWATLAVPAVLVLERSILRSAWSSRPADPAAHRRGSVRIWAALLIGVVLASIACLVSGSLLPGGLLIGVMLTLLVVLRPPPAALGAGLERP